MPELELVRGTSCPDGVACPKVYRRRGGTVVLQGYASTAIELADGQRAVRVPATLIGEAAAHRGGDVRLVADGQVVVRGRLASADLLGDVWLGDGELLIELPPALSRQVPVGHG